MNGLVGARDKKVRVLPGLAFSVRRSYHFAIPV